VNETFGTPSQGSYDPATGAWSGLTLASGDSVSMTLMTLGVTINPSATGSFSNTVTVSGTSDPNSANNTATDTDTLTPLVDLQVTKTDGTATVAPGTSDTYTITVTNNGPSTAVASTVTDVFPPDFTAVNWTASASSGSSVAQASGAGDINTTVTLLPGGTATYTAVAQISSSASGLITNTATVSAPAGVTDTNPGNNSATDTDVLAGIHVVKFVNGQDADTAPGPHVAAGSTVTFTYVVTDTGGAPLQNVNVTDDKLGPIVGFTGDTNGNGLLDQTETWVYTATATALAGQQTNVATVTAQDVNSGTTVTDDNPANYFGDLGGVHIVKFVNGQDADSPAGPHVPVGSTVTFTYVVTDTGNAALQNVHVTDDTLGTITSFTGDTNGNGLLDQTETWTYTATATALAGEHTNVATVTAQNVTTAAMVTDDNPANYYGGQPADNDFNADGGSDVAWRNDSGQVYLWEMNGLLQPKSEGSVAQSVTSDWHIQASGDFDGDGSSDILWRDDSGSVYFWEMNGLQIKDQGSPSHALVTNDWHIEGTGDFDGDRHSDILWQQDSGQVYIWEMNGLQINAEGAVAHAAVTNDWHFQGTGDFNADGTSDVVWRQDSGQVYVWEMNGFQVNAESAVAHAAVTSNWHFQGTGDFDGDGKSDILWRDDGGQVYVWEMNGSQVKAEGAVAHAFVASDWHFQGTGDYNGDGKTDVFWRQDSGQVYVWEMNGLQVTAEGAVTHAPVTNDWHVALA
jgi:uncharacterized repeat protein (TIGR01451 family)